MKLIVGLGNPGREYERSRHNAGYLVLDRVADRHAVGVVARARFHSAVVDTTIRGHRCLLIKPTTYMNRSGRAVAEAIGFFRLDPAHDLLVIVDDVALPAGVIRLRAEGGAGGHNGLADIQAVLDTPVFPRLRVGIDPAPAFMDQADYVLSRFTDEQWSLVEPALERAADAVEVFLDSGILAAMNRFNRKVGGADPNAGPGKDDRGPPERPEWPGNN